MGPEPHRTIAVVLAAGGGSRFSGPEHKLLAELDGQAVARASIGAALAAGIGDVVVVTGAADIAPVLASFTGDDAERLTVAHNGRWSDGQASSLQVAIAEAGRRDIDAIVVGLADQPFVSPDAWRLVAASSSPIAVAAYGGRRRNPVRLHRSVWPLLPTTGDEGARSVAHMRPDLVQEVPCPGSAVDIDTREDLKTWQNRSSTNSR